MLLLRMSGGTLYPRGPCCPFLPLDKGNEDSGNEIVQSDETNSVHHCLHVNKIIRGEIIVDIRGRGDTMLSCKTRILKDNRKGSNCVESTDLPISIITVVINHSKSVSLIRLPCKNVGKERDGLFLF